MTDAAAYFQANRAQWDDRTGIHVASDFYDVEGWLRDAPGPRQREVEALGDVAGRTLVHLQCHFGLDTLSFARAGATVTGLDFSPVAVDAARDLARRAGLADRATFVCANVEDAPSALRAAGVGDGGGDGAGRFDIVYVSLGALCWLPSVESWAAVVAAALAPGGTLYLHDVHPLAWSMAERDTTLEYTYFEETEPFADDSEETYTDQTRPLVHTRNYEWNHSLGEIVSALLGQGLRIAALTEHDWTVWPRWDFLVPSGEGRDRTWSFPPGRTRLPLTFTLLADRAANPDGRGASRPACG